MFHSRHILSFAALAALVSINLRAGVVEIASSADFVEKIAANPAGEFKLTADIDLADAGYVSIPEFSGTLDGNGKTLTGLGAQAFCKTNAGAIASLTIDGTVDGVNTTWSMTGAGVFACVSMGGKFTDCATKGYTLNHTVGNGGFQTIPAANGLIAGVAYDGSRFVRCSADASCSLIQNGKGNNQQGGIVGVLVASDPNGVIAEFVGCVNFATITTSANGNDTSSGSGGILGMIKNCHSSILPEVFFIQCRNEGAILGNRNTNIGGILGFSIAGGNGSGTRVRFANCTNRGGIAAAENMAAGEVCYGGGITGRIADGSIAHFGGCANFGVIAGGDHMVVGGMLGNFKKQYQGVDSIVIENCVNCGSVTGTTVGGLVGEIVNVEGWAKDAYRFRNSANYGTVEGATTAGQFIGKLTCSTSSGFEIDSCWVADEPLYGSASKTPTGSGAIIATAEGYDHAAALASLNASGNVAYFPWVAGEGERPELCAFADDSGAANHYVLFCDWDGSLIKSDLVADGAAATPPPDPIRESYRFTGWDCPFDNVKTVLLPMAQYDVLEFTFTFDSDGGSSCAPQTYAYGATVTLPVPVREGFSFAGWMESDMAVKTFATCPNYDPALTALWRQERESASRKLKVLNISMNKENARNDITKCLMEQVCEHRPDVVISEGWVANVQVENLKTEADYPALAENAPEEYGFWLRQFNMNQTNARLFGVDTNRFAVGEMARASLSQNATFAYMAIRERGTDNYYVIVGTTFWSMTGRGYFDVYLPSIKTTMDVLRQKFPTATFLMGANQSSIEADKDYESKYHSSAAEYKADFEARTGMTEFQPNDDLLWTLYSSAHEPCTIEQVSVRRIGTDVATQATRPGYLTAFKIGKSVGLMLFVR